MMLSAATLRAVAAGDVTLAFRSWTTPRVRAGGSQLTAVGVIEFTSVTKVQRVTAADAKAAGFASVAEVTAWLARRPGEIYRVELRLAGEDPRVALRESTEIDDVAAALVRKSWAHAVLRAIAARPGEVSTSIATDFGWERQSLKNRVRQLKALGLTESLDVGYRLSPRGRAYLDSLG